MGSHAGINALDNSIQKFYLIFPVGKVWKKRPSNLQKSWILMTFLDKNQYKNEIYTDDSSLLNCLLIVSGIYGHKTSPFLDSFSTILLNEIL